MSNPYQSPPSSFSDQPLSSMGSMRPIGRGKIGHFRVLAILMMVQGVLSCLVGVGFLVAAVMLPSVLAGNPEFAKSQGPNAPSPESMKLILGAS